MRGVPPVALPEHARAKLSELTLARDQALDAMRSAQARANNLPGDAGHLRERLAQERWHKVAALQPAARGHEPRGR